MDGTLILSAIVNETYKRAYSGPLGYLRSGYEDLRHLGTSLGVVPGGRFWVNSEVNSEVNLRPILDPI